jgi:predicted RNA binding protein YcfA (HicA-like mRNA interferase family)
VKIDYKKLRKITAHQVVRALLYDGFVIRNQSGSHIRFVHQDGRRVTVSFHRPGQTFPPKTLKTMLEQQANWKYEDLQRLKLLR